MTNKGNVDFEAHCGEQYRDWWYWEEFMNKNISSGSVLYRNNDVIMDGDTVERVESYSTSFPERKQRSGLASMVFDRKSIASEDSSQDLFQHRSGQFVAPNYPIIVIDDSGDDEDGYLLSNQQTMKTTHEQTDRPRSQSGNNVGWSKNVMNNQNSPLPHNNETLVNKTQTQSNSSIPNSRLRTQSNPTQNKSNLAQTEQVVKLFWKSGGKEVQAIGSWNDWKEPFILEKVINGFEGNLHLPKGHYSFLFIVDGKYKVDRFEHFVIHQEDEPSNEANYIYVGDEIIHTTNTVPQTQQPIPESNDSGPSTVGFSWPGKVGQNVKLYGSWKWKKANQMIFNGQEFQLRIPLRPGTYYFRYNIDGRIQLNDRLPKAKVMLGNLERVANVIKVGESANK